MWGVAQKWLFDDKKGNKVGAFMDVFVTRLNLS
jgi:hypothetical protein